MSNDTIDALIRKHGIDAPDSLTGAPGMADFRLTRVRNALHEALETRDVMLAALRRVKNHIEFQNRHLTTYPLVWKDVDDAIARAEGRY